MTSSQITRACLAILAFPCATLAQTQPATTASTAPASTATPPAYTVVRWDEDYSYLKDPSKRSDLFDPLKYIPLGDNSYLSLGGQARYRYEYYNNLNFGAGTQDENGFHLTRFLLHGDLHLGDNFRFFLEGKSSMEDGRDGGPRPSDADENDIQQAFADLILPLGDKQVVTLRGGRQEMMYGVQRLIAPNDWGNVHNTFEGGKVIYASRNNQLDVFWVRPVVVDKEQLNDGDGTRSLEGIYNTLALPDFLAKAGTKWELYALGLNVSQESSGGVDGDYYTVGSRFSTKPKPWDFEIEADWQFGEYAGETLGAYSLGMEGGYTFADLALTPRALLGFELGSGSADGSGRFNPLFPSIHHYYGYIDLFGRQNMMDLHSGVTLAVTKKILFRAEEHVFWRQNISDAVYTGQGNVLRADNGSNAAYVGNEIDLLFNIQFTRHLTGYVGYSHFFTGDFIQQTGPAEDVDFFYASVSYTF